MTKHILFAAQKDVQTALNFKIIHLGCTISVCDHWLSQSLEQYHY
jgi:hypothetical protein